MKVKNKNKVTWITGASSGIGKATTKLLLLQDYIVYAADNRSKNMDELKQLGAYIIKMDPCNDTDMQSAIDEIIANEGRIDLLVNGAGFAHLNTAQEFSKEEIVYQLESSALDWARIIELALPYMTRQKSGKIINIVSSYQNIIDTLAERNNKLNLLNTVNLKKEEEAESTGVCLMLIESKVVPSDSTEIKIQNNIKHLYAKFNKKMEHVKFSFLKLHNSTGRDEQMVAQTVLKSIVDLQPLTRFPEKYLSVVPQFFKKLYQNNKTLKNRFREMA
jgi:NADP-dependent 3-hydroxy acid dehydrogenase YdfG